METSSPIAELCGHCHHPRSKHATWSFGSIQGCLVPVGGDKCSCRAFVPAALDATKDGEPQDAGEREAGSLPDSGTQVEPSHPAISPTLIERLRDTADWIEAVTFFAAGSMAGLCREAADCLETLTADLERAMTAAEKALAVGDTAARGWKTAEARCAQLTEALQEIAGNGSVESGIHFVGDELSPSECPGCIARAVLAGVTETGDGQ